jgi:hypothetical protein
MFGWHAQRAKLWAIVRFLTDENDGVFKIDRIFSRGGVIKPRLSKSACYNSSRRASKSVKKVHYPLGNYLSLT